MVRRFQIEDMVAQDASGVVFRALDVETGLPVAVRRFFPFGANGGGLSVPEQADYNAAMEHLAGIRHPAMRAIITGGCDPVDGMPFIATEWVEGQPLQIKLEQAPLTPAEATHLLTLAIEVCWQISQVLGAEAVWIETDVQTIIVGAEGDGRDITFWISPLKWLGKNDGERGMKSLASLTEDVMGWRGKMIHDHEGGGLGGWLKWLRQAPPQTSLHQAWEKLAAAAQSTAPPPARRLARPPVLAAIPVRRKAPSKIPFLIGSTLTLTAISLGGWGLIQWNNARLNVTTDPVTRVEQPGEVTTTSEIPPEAAAFVSEGASEMIPGGTSKPGTKTAEQVRLDAAEFGKSLQNAEQAKADRIAAVAARNGIHYLEDSELLLDRKGDEVMLEGKLDAVERSNNGKGKTIYLIFSGGRARGGVEIAKAAGDLAESALAGLIGKKLQIRGIVKIDGVSPRFPVVVVKTRSSIQETP
ncbi:MAG: hypothetical protein ACRCXD_07175 [Luteolibacter sp.]